MKHYRKGEVRKTKKKTYSMNHIWLAELVPFPKMYSL